MIMVSIVWTILIWASRDKVFNDVSMFDLNMSQAAYFRGGSRSKPVHPSLWSPLIRVSKLNFDGSFLFGGEGEMDMVG